MLAAVAGLLLAACGSGEEAPPTNPLNDTTTVTATATLPAVVPTDEPAPTGPAPIDPNDTEAATGRALTLLAEWLGVPATNFSIGAAEPIEWSDACLGVAYPGMACAQVITPGFRIELLDVYLNPHAVHLDTSGGAVWAGQMADEGVVVDVQLAAGRIRIEVDGDLLILRLAPGTATPGLAEGSAALQPGMGVAVTFDAAPDGNEPPVVASIVPLE